MQLFYQPEINQGIELLDAEESKHCIKVLRRKVGDIIHITDGNGVLYEAKITKADANACAFTVLSTKIAEELNYSIHLLIAPTKNPDRIEWLIEKAVEIGVDKISFILCSNSERPTIKVERLYKKAVIAMKQSLALKLPEIQPIADYKTTLENIAKTDEKFIAYVDDNHQFHLKEKATAGKNYAILIGPEGDFTKEEIDFAFKNHFQAVSLGKKRLRTETAGMVACLILNLLNE